MVHCSDCKLDKDPESFAKNRSTKSGRNSICKACKKVRDARHYLVNGEKMRTHNKQYNQDNKEWYYQYCRDWNASHRSDMVEANHIVRAKAFYDGPIDRINPKVLYERDHGICGICSLPVTEDVGDESIDHIVPFSRGGYHIWANVQLAHILCNQRKSNKLPEELAHGE